jgi:glycosyltransferase involved in cell wall biosynthesis
MSKNKMIIIAWAERLDNASDFAKRLGFPFYCIYDHMFSDYPFLVPFRYFLQTLQTWKILLSQKPILVHVTNPPIIAALNVFLYCKLFHARYLLCTHPPALYSRKWGWTVPLLRFLARHALLNTVDQERFRVLFESWGAKAMVLTKMPRAYPPSEIDPNPDCKYDITVVNTFAPDEPLEPILGAAESLTNVRFYILGNLALADQKIVSKAPANVIFTDWLSHDQYWEKLKHSQAIMTLTTYPHSLLAGGTDGMAVGVPIILSRQPALTEYFTMGTIFVDHSPESIVDGVRRLKHEQNRLQQEIVELAIEKRKLWDTNFQKLLDIIENQAS